MKSESKGNKQYFLFKAIYQLMKYNAILNNERTL